MLTRVLALLFALALGGCANMQLWKQPQQVGLSAEEGQVLDLIGYAQRVAGMSAEQQQLAYVLDTQAFESEKSDLSRVRLALLLSTPGTKVEDDGRAAELLASLAAGGEQAGPLRRLAGLVYLQVTARRNEQKRTEELRQQGEAERDRDQKQVEQLRQQIDAERQREQKQVELLRQQIEALKSVERAITQRGTQGQPRQ